MSVKIERLESTQTSAWDAYVHAHSKATLYHLSGWGSVVEKTYGHKTYYLMATKKELDHETRIPPNSSKPTIHKSQIIGILPLVHMKHFLFGNSLISMPFFDIGGVLANDEEVEKTMVSEAIKIAQELKVDNIELRHVEPFSWLKRDGSEMYSMKHQQSDISWDFQTRSHKVRMLLDLPESSEVLMKSFKAKLRNQIKKPINEGLYIKLGGVELLSDFYRVFSIHMRDLGSPVHAKNLMQNVLQEFPKESRIVAVYKDNQPIGCSMIIGFKETLENPWASSLREFSKLSPNMLLYWAMLEYACDNGFACFDFGRSSPDEGTYRFKKQWGARASALHWHYISADANQLDEGIRGESRYRKATHYWRKVPVPLTKILGPRLRKHIAL
jgi:serine/alanine adding enzyme